MASRVSLDDLAQQLGVSRMTVSRALRRIPGVADDLAERIRDLAEKAGYQTDARVSSVMGALRHSKTPEYLETLGFIFTHRQHFSDEHLRGACEAAAKLGYRVDAIKPWESGMSGSNVSRVLQSRGIRGVLLSPNSHASHPHYTLDWQKFATVLLGSSLANKKLPRVKVNHFAITQMAVRKMLHLGYLRLGLVVDRVLDERTNREISSAFRAWANIGDSIECPILFMEPTIGRKDLINWIRQRKLDAVIGDTGFRLTQWLEPMGCKAPRDLGYATISVEGVPGVSGILQDLKGVGSKGVQLLDSLLKQRQFGLQSDPSLLLVSGSWQAGTTAVPVRTVAAK